METDIIHVFAPSRTVIRNDSTCFLTIELIDTKRQYEGMWKPVLSYESMSNGMQREWLEHWQKKWPRREFQKD